MSRHKLLLADDSITIQKVVNLTFADEGIEVISVSDGDAAMEKFAEISPDLVLADVNMPGLDGYKICEKIKNDADFRHTPVILLVGSFEPFDEAEAKRVGADDYLTKPFQSIRQLVNKVSSMLENGENIQADAAVSDSAEQSENPEAEFVMSSSAFGDAAMDDEMIEENKVSDFVFDETAKFATKDYEEDFQAVSPETAVQYTEDSVGYIPSSAEMTTENITAEEIVYGSNREEFSATEESGYADVALSESAAAENKKHTFFDDDDEDLLGLASDESGKDEPETISESIGESEKFEENREERSGAPAETYIGSLTGKETVENLPAETSAQFSPETIEAIAQRIAEKISAQITPQVSELIAQELEREKNT